MFGIALHLIYGANSKVLETTTDWFSIVGDGYVALLQMIVMPLIFIQLCRRFSEIQIGDKFAKVVLIFLCFNWYCSYSRYSRIFMPLSLDLMPQALIWVVQKTQGSELVAAKDLTANTLPQTNS